jgi:signal transduction histidine kinase
MKLSAIQKAGVGAVAGLACAVVGTRLLPFLLSTRYLPHRYCYLAQPWLVWTNVVTDSLIFASYASIFGSLWWMANRLRGRNELSSYLWVIVSFGAFILACGVTHAMETVTVWLPVYRLSALMKVVAAIVSVPTAIFFGRAAPAIAEHVHRFLNMLSTSEREKEMAVSALVASEKLAVVGRLSASISHEINNPLEAVGNVLYILRNDPAIPAESLSLLKTAEAELFRAAKIASNTLMFYRESVKPVEVSLDELVQSVFQLLKRRFDDRGIRVSCRFRGDQRVEAFPGELKQVIINLLQNAGDAIDKDGEIFAHVQARTQHGKQGYAITVADTGKGMDQEHRAQLFKMFFTTKGLAGTGLGLWLVKSILDKHHGTVRIRSRLGVGTVFSIWLPRQLKHAVSGELLPSRLAPVELIGGTT